MSYVILLSHYLIRDMSNCGFYCNFLFSPVLPPMFTSSILVVEIALEPFTFLCTFFTLVLFYSHHTNFSLYLKVTFLYSLRLYRFLIDSQYHLFLDRYSLCRDLFRLCHDLKIYPLSVTLWYSIKNTT